MALELSFEHDVYYGTKEPLAIKDVIESLVGMDRIASSFLADAYSALLGVEILSVEAKVQGFEDGSFLQRFLLILTFGSEQGMDDFALKLRSLVAETYKSLPGERYPVFKGVAFSSVLATLVALGAFKAINAVAVQNSEPSPASQQPSVSINLENSPVVIIGAEAYSMSPQEFLGVIESVAAQDQKKLAENSVRIIRPAKREEGGSSLHIGGLDMPALDQEIVAQAPSTFTMEAEDQRDDHYDVDLQIRATDRDKTTTGWSGVIPDLVNTRVRLKLAEGIDPNRLANHARVRANVVVHSRFVRNKREFVPHLIEVVSLVDDSVN